MKEGSDTTPVETKIILIAVLVLSLVVFCLLTLGFIDTRKQEHIALILWVFTALFIIRVAGQILVASAPQEWLPPMDEWNFIPYWMLLPIQLLIIGLMFWTNITFFNESGALMENPSYGGWFLILLSTVYVIAMLIRYIIKIACRADRRWFGGSIPIVFHLVLASYLYTLGCFYASM